MIDTKDTKKKTVKAKAPKAEKAEKVVAAEVEKTPIVEETSQAEAPKATEEKTSTKVEKKEEKSATVSKAKTMEELLKNTKNTLHVPKKGDSVEGIINGITKKSLTLDIGAKTEGVVADKEFEMARE